MNVTRHAADARVPDDTEWDRADSNRHPLA